MTGTFAALSFPATVLANAVASVTEQTVTLAVENMYCDACPIS